MQIIRHWKMLVRFGWLAVMLASLLQASWLSAAGTQAGPLSQFANNVHKLHVAARYRTSYEGIPIIAVVVQTVVATAVKSTATETYWVIEREHVDPEFFYRERNVTRGTSIRFQFFFDAFSPEAAVEPTAGDPVSIVKLEAHYALLREAQARHISEIPIATPLELGEEVSIIYLAKWEIMKPATLGERTARVVQAGTPLAFINLPLSAEAKDEDKHGEPVFALRDGSWQLAGIRVAHVRSPQPDWSAVAQLPPLSELIPPPSKPKPQPPPPPEPP